MVFNLILPCEPNIHICLSGQEILAPTSSAYSLGGRDEGCGTGVPQDRLLCPFSRGSHEAWEVPTFPLNTAAFPEPLPLKKRVKALSQSCPCAKR